jgi:hypothetical protein
VFVGYACAEGELADDNPVGSHGLYTTSLLKHLPVPGQNINDMYADVITDVENASEFQQSPYVMSSESARQEPVLVQFKTHTPRAPGTPPSCGMQSESASQSCKRSLMAAPESDLRF